MISALQPDRIEAGCDEAGRGCLAGPVFAAAVILPGECHIPLLNDSKKLSATIRSKLRIEIEQTAVAWAVAMLDNQQIDQANILRASIMAMHAAIRQLTVKPGHLLIDGNRFLPFEDIGHTCIVKGDSKYASIAAASVLAKTHRDEYMQHLHLLHPDYGWAVNKGYPTRDHRKAIVRLGITPFHRRSFRLTNAQHTIRFDLPDA